MTYFDLSHSFLVTTNSPRNALPQHLLRQPLTSPARRSNLTSECIRTLKQHADTTNDLVLFGKGG